MRVAEAIAAYEDRRALIAAAEIVTSALEVGRAFALRWEERKAREGLLDGAADGRFVPEVDRQHSARVGREETAARRIEDADRKGEADPAIDGLLDAPRAPERRLGFGRRRDGLVTEPGEFAHGGIMHGIAQGVGLGHAGGLGFGDEHLADRSQAGRTFDRGGATDETDAQETEGQGEQTSGGGHGEFIGRSSRGDKQDLRTRG